MNYYYGLWISLFLSRYKIVFPSYYDWWDGGTEQAIWYGCRNTDNCLKFQIVSHSRILLILNYIRKSTELLRFLHRTHCYKSVSFDSRSATVDISSWHISLKWFLYLISHRYCFDLYSTYHKVYCIHVGISSIPNAYISASTQAKVRPL